jgi:hypothetical protein
LKKETKGKINLYKTGSIYLTVLDLFNRFTKVFNPESIKLDEGEWIYNSSIGPIMYCNGPYKGPGYKYDYVSNYPSIMKDSYCMFPIKRGTFIKLDKLPEQLKYGIYRCIIIKTDNSPFRINKKNYYTHVDIKYAISRNFAIELIQDDEPNCLFYTADQLINGSLLFGKYVDYVYDLKERLGKDTWRPKKILNLLWGILCKYKLKTIKRYNDCPKEKEYDITNQFIRSIVPSDDHNRTFVELYSTKIYKYNFARIGTFLLSFGRRKILDCMDKFTDNKLLHANTDGFILKRPIICIQCLGECKNKTKCKFNRCPGNCYLHECIKYKPTIGELRFEGYSDKVKIKNCMNVKGDFEV